MVKLHLIQAAPTCWEDQQRMDSAAGAPLTQQGVQAIIQIAKELSAAGIKMVYCGEGEAEVQAAEMLAQAFGVKTKPDCRLREMDYGLWQGLTQKEINRRQPRVFRQWQEAPAAVRPPEGEILAEIQQRVCKALGEILPRYDGAAIAIVLRPVALGLVRLKLTGANADKLWQCIDKQFHYECFEISPEQVK